ncbi:hypothetical protein PYW08_009550 [Mythimna loreyi]|uniref:Uncharacterized protein n=1 Tax=Mythimna loreyi TaxID=667449 RepID=A0ACC2Q820_9NEOP|nr:hypothetical protein PYW08_009550 [Mythimna loreyi]
MNFFFKCFVLTLCLNLIEGAFRCDYNYIPTSKSWFKHHVMPATWDDARTTCSLEGATLASPITEVLELDMIEIIEKSFTPETEVFTGIHASTPAGAFHTIEGIPFSEIPLTWAPNQPDNKNDKEKCITLNGKGEIADRSCEEPRPFICYSGNVKAKPNECGNHDPEYFLDKRMNKCYKLHSTPRNFSRAFLACSAEGGHLAIINSDLEAKVLIDLFAKYPAKDMLGNGAYFWKEVAFVGFYDWGFGDWKTIEGQPIMEAGYAKFKSGEPNNSAPGEKCGSMYRKGELNDLWCDRPAAFFCEKFPNIPAYCEVSSKRNVTNS